MPIVSDFESTVVSLSETPAQGWLMTEPTGWQRSGSAKLKEKTRITIQKISIFFLVFCLITRGHIQKSIILASQGTRRLALASSSLGTCCFGTLNGGKRDTARQIEAGRSSYDGFPHTSGSLATKRRTGLRRKPLGIALLHKQKQNRPRNQHHRGP